MLLGVKVMIKMEYHKWNQTQLHHLEHNIHQRETRDLVGIIALDNLSTARAILTEWYWIVEMSNKWWDMIIDKLSQTDVL